MTTEHAWRFTTLAALLSALAFFIIIQMFRIQVSPEAEVFREIGNAYAGHYEEIKPPRGPIYDRWGNLLAGNQTVYEVGLDLRNKGNPATIALALNVVVGADHDAVFAAASQDYAPGTAVYAVLADYVTVAQKEQLEKLSQEMDVAYGKKDDEDRPSLQGLLFEPHLQRTYPDKALASNILGFVNRQGEGFFGVEERYNDILAGSTERVWVPADPNKAVDMPTVESGSSLILTIDRSVQSAMEEVLANGLNQSGAESGTIVVMDPATGEIMAIATTPVIDLNEFWRVAEVFEGATPFNRAVSESYEPGSVFKVLTMSAALDNDTVTPETQFLDTGLIEIGGAQIRNWNWGAWGPQDMVGCMQHSLNVCLAWVASQVGARDFYNYLEAFGLGRLTGVDLAGEVPGRLKLPGDGDWYEADLGTNSFGQGVSVTPIQMIAAVSALANEGRMMTPHIIHARVDQGREYNTAPQVAGMPISAETAETITQMLAVSLEEESSDALIEGYRVAGKTGTAEIPTPAGYTSSVTNASFVGWGPVDDPQFLVYVWLEKPTTSPWGSVVAAPVFREAVERLVVLLKLPPDDVRLKWMDSQ